MDTPEYLKQEIEFLKAELQDAKNRQIQQSTAFESILQSCQGSENQFHTIAAKQVKKLQFQYQGVIKQLKKSYSRDQTCKEQKIRYYQQKLGDTQKKLKKSLQKISKMRSKNKSRSEIGDCLVIQKLLSENSKLQFQIQKLKSEKSGKAKQIQKKSQSAFYQLKRVFQAQKKELLNKIQQLKQEILSKKIQSVQQAALSTSKLIQNHSESFIHFKNPQHPFCLQDPQRIGSTDLNKTQISNLDKTLHKKPPTHRIQRSTSLTALSDSKKYSKLFKTPHLHQIQEYMPSIDIPQDSFFSQQASNLNLTERMSMKPPSQIQDLKKEISLSRIKIGHLTNAKEKAEIEYEKVLLTLKQTKIELACSKQNSAQKEWYAKCLVKDLLDCLGTLMKHSKIKKSLIPKLQVPVNSALQFLKSSKPQINM